MLNAARARIAMACAGKSSYAGFRRSGGLARPGGAAGMGTAGQTIGLTLRIA
jgi:hypothetical protein